MKKRGILLLLCSIIVLVAAGLVCAWINEMNQKTLTDKELKILYFENKERINKVKDELLNTDIEGITFQYRYYKGLIYDEKYTKSVQHILHDITECFQILQEENQDIQKEGTRYLFIQLFTDEDASRIVEFVFWCPKNRGWTLRAIRYDPNSTSTDIMWIDNGWYILDDAPIANRKRRYNQKLKRQGLRCFGAGYQRGKPVLLRTNSRRYTTLCKR